MCNWRRWIWPGILATVLLTALAMLMRSGTIEQDLQTKALGALSANHDWAQVALDGRDLTLTGEAPSEEAAAEALAIAENAYDVRVARSQTTLLPIADPFTLSAVKEEGGRITLSGSVPPDAGIRTAIVDAARASSDGAEVVDELTLNRGAPGGFSDLASFGISQLSGLSSGSASLSGSDLAIEGTAKTRDSWQAIETALSGAIPGGGNLSRDAVMAPPVSPYTFSAAKGESGVTLEGYVPDDETRAALVSAANAVTDGTVTDRLEIGSGAAGGFSDLASFGIARLGDFSTGSASLSDLDLTIRGTALSPEAYDSAMAALAGTIPGSGNLAVEDITRSTVSPYTLDITREKGVIVLDGHVASEAERSAAEDFAKATSPADRIVNRLVVANGAPQGVDWGGAGQFALRQLSTMTTGKVALSDTGFSIRGVARDKAALDAIEADVTNSLPAGMELASSDLSLPVISPYVWSFENMEGKAPRLAGYEPADSLGDANVEQIAARLGSEYVVDNQLEIGNGAPRGFEAATSVAIASASRLVNGKAELAGTDLMVSGEALTEQAAEEIRAQIQNGLPPGFAGKHNISVRSAAAMPAISHDECQQLLDSHLKHNSIRFETAKAIIHEDSFGLLDRLAFAVQRCPTATVEIEGHTDSDGADDYNQTLSEARANAVRSYLVNSGIFVGRLQARGYGENHPVADNSTEEGKALNRRIEFTVIQ